MLLVLHNIAYFVVVALHVYFVVLEMALWKRLAPKVFRITPEYAQQSAAMASNQGLYNLFLVVALIIGFVGPYPYSDAFTLYSLGCVIVAGTWGAITISRKIFFIQALPAIITIALGAIPKLF